MFAVAVQLTWEATEAQIWSKQMEVLSECEVDIY